MRLFGRDLYGPAKALVIMVAVLLVSAGMCGLQLTIAGQIYNSSGAFGGVMMLLGIVELLAMFVSLIGIAVVLISLLARLLFVRDESSSSDWIDGGFDITSDSGKIEGSESANGDEEDRNGPS